MKSVVIVLFFVSNSLAVYNICVVEKNADSCQRMVAAGKQQGLNLSCVTAADSVHCILKILRKEAHAAPFDAEDMYIPAEYFNDDLVVFKEMRSSAEADVEYRYHAVAVVKKSANINHPRQLKGAKSCHTGFGRTAGWNVPIPRLLQDQVSDLDCDAGLPSVEQEIRSVSRLFSKACVSGKWSPDKETDSVLKNKYKSLCALCKNPEECSQNDDYAHYDGAIRCITEGDGNVAWSKVSEVRKFFGLDGSPRKAPASEYSYLCPDGGTMELTAKNPCSWAGRPWQGFLTHKEVSRAEVQQLQKQIKLAADLDTSKTDWFTKVLGFSEKYSVGYDNNPVISASVYLSKGNYTLTIERPACKNVKIAKFCTRSPKEYSKCHLFAMAAFSRRVSPRIGCIKGSSTHDCMKKIHNGEADMISLDGGEIYEGGKRFNLKPVLSEQYGELKATYYSVAVIRAGSGIDTFQELKGKKSCHTGYGRTAGWNVPVYILYEKNLIKPKRCNFAQAVGDFFSQSCVPGAKQYENDQSGSNPKSLCSLCYGEDKHIPVQGRSDSPPYQTGKNKCVGDSREAYNGYTGAFRCLAERGDVAFLKHNTVADNTDGRNNATWAKNLKSSDFQVLCKDGGTVAVNNYESCYLAKVPSHKIMTAGKKKEYEVEEIRLSLLRAVDKFGVNQTIFRLFGEFEGKNDLLFKDSTTKLNNLISGSTYHDSLEKDYEKMLEEIKSCNYGANSSYSFRASNIAVSIIIFSVHLFLFI